MQTPLKRIAINFGGGYVPGLNAVITGVVLAASELGWEVVGIRDGFDGLLFPDRYPDGGLVKLTPAIVESLSSATGCILGTAARSDPFHVRTINAENQVEEVDRSDELLETIQPEKIDAVISVVGARALSILLKLHRKGLKTVCVPKSVENDMAATMLSFGFNSALSFAVEMLDRCRAGGGLGAPNRRRRSVGRARRVAGAASRHGRVRRCRAHPRDSLRPRQGRGEAAREVAGRDERPGWWWWPKVRSRWPALEPVRGTVGSKAESRRSRQEPRARRAPTSSNDPARLAERWRLSFNA